MEHISEADTLVRCSRIPTIHGLVNVPLQVLLAHRVIDAEDHPLEVSPKALDGVGRDTLSVAIHLQSVLNDIMDIALLG